MLQFPYNWYNQENKFYARAKTYRQALLVQPTISLNNKETIWFWQFWESQNIKQQLASCSLSSIKVNTNTSTPILLFRRFVWGGGGKRWRNDIEKQIKSRTCIRITPVGARLPGFVHFRMPRCHQLHDFDLSIFNLSVKSTSAVH